MTSRFDLPHEQNPLATAPDGPARSGQYPVIAKAVMWGQSNEVDVYGMFSQEQRANETKESAMLSAPHRLLGSRSSIDLTGKAQALNRV